MILETLLAVTSTGVIVLSVFGSVAAREAAKLARAHKETLIADRDQTEAHKRAMNELGRRLASGAALQHVVGKCLDPECKEHGEKNRGK